MEFSYDLTPEAYIEYAQNFSKKTPAGKQGRKRFYIGFSFLYLILATAFLIYLMYYQLELFAPTFIMAFITYAILMVAMNYTDVVGLGHVRKARIIVKEQKKLIHNTIVIDGDKYTLNSDGKTQDFSVKKCTGISETANHVIIYDNPNSGVCIPKKVIKKKQLEKLHKIFDEV